jgi:hypothetical protein
MIRLSLPTWRGQEEVRPDPAFPIGEMSDHHVIFIPTHSHVDHGLGKPSLFRLVTTLSVHKIRYYNTDGELVQEFLRDKVALRPMETYQVRVSPKDTSGLGVPAPIAAGVHVGTSATVGPSFVTRGTPLVPNVVPDNFTR